MPVSWLVLPGAGESVPDFDVLLLGVGPDGHICSLFPGHPALDVVDRPTAAVEDSPKPPPQRVTLTFPALARARHTWFVVSGEDKADAVTRAIEGAPTRRGAGGHAARSGVDAVAGRRAAAALRP